MIPKKIHYCWFGRNPLPKLACKCIESWKKFFPDYEIIEWNENNFDVHMIPYSSEAYKAKKYAFVSDFARFWILYHHGGLYFDTDVEVIRSMEDIIDCGSFMGCENVIQPGEKLTSTVAPGLGLGAIPGLNLYKEIIDYYKTLSFYKSNGSYNQKTVVAYTTEILQKHGLTHTSIVQNIDDIWIYPKDYFCPIDYVTKQLIITQNTRSIHHYTASWITRSQRIYKFVERCIGSKIAGNISSILKNLKLVK